MKKTLLIFLLAGSAHATPEQSYISKIYCKMLGNSDVKEEYRKLVYKALEELDVPNHEAIPIKKMNNVGPIIALMPLSSFTAFGIWFDEDYLDSCSPEQKVFQIYHEAAHYAQRHHQKVLAASATLTALAAIGMSFLNNELNENNSPHSLAITLGASAATVTLMYLGILPLMVKHQEKTADLEASKKLISSGNAGVVEAHIQSLRHSTPSHGNIWWFSDKEQADYLEKTMQKKLLTDF
jgi:hypothetical protein